MKEQLALENIVILNDRAENLAHKKTLRGRYQMVTARAVAELAVLLELTIPFCAPGGYVVAYKGPNYQTELEKATRALLLLDTVLTEEWSYQLPYNLGWRTLLVFQKKDQLPKNSPDGREFPRNDHFKCFT